MTQQEIKELAKNIVGDGGTPNKWFVTTGPYYRPGISDPDWNFELIKGFSDDDVMTYGPFDTYEDAADCYEAETLYMDAGIGHAFIEDRQCGVVREKWLTKRVVVEYEEEEQDDSHYFYKQ